MRLFLSSYRFGSDPARLLEVTRGPGRIAVIANACDAWPSRARASSVISEFGPLRALGYDPEEVDLRDHLGDPGSLRPRLTAFSAVWVRGGNTFVLRAQLARSGGDTVLTDMVDAGTLAYAGYSAGACVATPTLRGLEFSDDPAEVTEIGAGPVVWDGLGWVEHSIVPHAGDSALGDGGVDRTLEYLRREYIPYVALTDDDALVIGTGGDRTRR
jgi:dipeptidase E